MHEGILNSELIVFENSGHFTHVEEPEAFLIRSEDGYDAPEEPLFTGVRGIGLLGSPYAGSCIDPVL
jgi:hypothetical protein